MKNFNKFIFIFIISFSFSSPLFSDDNVFFIDIDFVVKNSNLGKKTLNNISELDKKNINSLEKKNKILLELENDIKNKKNVISEKDFNDEVKNFQKKIKDFTKEKNQIVNNFNKTKKLELEKIFELFNPIISNYMKENNINILLDTKNIFMGNPKTNITEDILKIINNKLQ